MRNGLFFITAALLVAMGPAQAGPKCLGIPVTITGSTYCFGVPEQASPPKTTTIKVCPVIVNRSPDFQAKVAAQLENLPPDSEMWNAVSEWVNLRDQARKCRVQ